MKKINITQKGFTLIELVIVMVILGILAAVAAPQFVDMSGNATIKAQNAYVDSAQSSLAIAIAKNAANGTLPIGPTVTALSAALTPPGTAVATGIQATINGAAYVSKTYTDAACTIPTAAVGNIVLCVK